MPLRLVRTLLAAALVGFAAAANCQGSASSEPLYCQASIPDSGGQRYCDSQAILVGDTAPLEVTVRNDAFYTNSPVENTNYPPGTNIYLRGKLQAGKRMEVVFACKDTACTDAYDDMFEYTGVFEPGGDPEDEQILEDWKNADRATRGPRPQAVSYTHLTLPTICSV